MKENKKVIIIGGGFAGMASASLLAKEGYRVKLIEKNDQLGGRARSWKIQGFTFDMGPSWYWMPDVFENFYNHFGYKTSDFYELKRLDPGYRAYFSSDYSIDIPADMPSLEAIFEKLELGAGLKLRSFLKQAEYQYKIGMKEYVFRPSHSILEYFDIRLLKEAFQLKLFQSQRNHVQNFFKNPVLRTILEFPVLFLGGTAQNIPALYSMMNYADLTLGTWYPMGGMHQIVTAMEKICKEQGVEIQLEEEVEQIEINKARATAVVTSKGIINADFIISGADYAHTEQVLIPKEYRNYDSNYWDKRILSPSSLIFYIGLNTKLKDIQHHTLFFDESLDNHADEIYNKPVWPSKPLFYACTSSVTDPEVAPNGMENLFLLMPIAPGLKDSEEIREYYFNKLMDRLEKILKQNIRSSIVIKRSYAINDFIKDYHSFKGNAYGLANTLFQTAFLKPKMKASKIENLLFTGQLTVPGPGVPPSLISGEVAAREAIKILEKF